MDEQFAYKKERLVTGALEVRLGKDQRYRVYALRAFEAGETIEESPGLVFDPNFGYNPILKEIAFKYGEEKGLLSLGYGNMCDYAKDSNADYCFDAENRIVRLIANKDINYRDEILLDIKLRGVDYRVLSLCSTIKEGSFKRAFVKLGLLFLCAFLVSLLPPADKVMSKKSKLAAHSFQPAPIIFISAPFKNQATNYSAAHK